ncbi:MAG: putative HTH-type transcriptional regulator [Burkholderia plantarii]|nr:MAG: putative HTH-type transcriptional regulator [Burkholderia plantarii]
MAGAAPVLQSRLVHVADMRAAHRVPHRIASHRIRMSQRKALSTNPCPVARTVEVIGDRWSLLILRDAFDGIRRFGEFQRHLGIARNMLADRLQTLVGDGVLVLAPASDGSAYQEYVLTERGRALFPVIVAMQQWGETQLFTPGDVYSMLAERASGRPVASMLPRSRDGAPLSPDDTVVVRGATLHPDEAQAPVAGH